jgi:hypothetical protein
MALPSKPWHTAQIVWKNAAPDVAVRLLGGAVDVLIHDHLTQAQEQRQFLHGQVRHHRGRESVGLSSLLISWMRSGAMPTTPRTPLRPEDNFLLQCVISLPGGMGGGFSRIFNIHFYFPEKGLLQVTCAVTDPSQITAVKS